MESDYHPSDLVFANALFPGIPFKEAGYKLLDIGEDRAAESCLFIAAVEEVMSADKVVRDVAERFAAQAVGRPGPRPFSATTLKRCGLA